VNAIEELIAQCRAVVAEGTGPIAVQEFVRGATNDPELAEALGLAPGVNMLHNGEDVTILHVVMAPRPDESGEPIPHNHRMWAVIGVMRGSEENKFFRRAGSGLEPAGVKVLARGDVLVTDESAIHSVRNPSSDESSGALHVYGGDLISTEKSMWSEPNRSEQPFDFFQVVAS
jgi:predicted metal-dependent enzyme (double-stranded beta helix superfamily)